MQTQARTTQFWASRQPLPSLTFHGHVQNVQRKMARQSHPALFPILQALLYRWAGAWHREHFQQRVPCVVVFVLIRITCFAAVFLRICVFHVCIRRDHAHM